MLYRYYRRLRRMVRSWRLDAIRTDRNAVIQRVVAAAARESKDLLGRSGSGVRAAAPARANPAPVTAQLLGREPEDDAIPADQIGRRAHEIWVRNGRPMGTAAADWMQAEAELRAERRATP